ncbi:hypothetical protein E9O_05579 [Moraxella catarrhalis 12P80B1]|nr:hypothetical protein [Moraxella catarrhalis]EGE15097.1 hypothetical protein E9O_05579 [Moraxella catarrhalis 12P80B1]
MNFNINMNLDKVMNAFSQNKTLRVWSYIIAVLVVIGLFFIFGGELFKGIADIIRATQGQ